ncbi:MAG: hypothetical protein H8E44_13425 [Planctomycetes bacterium]|nr:hypothetical protein [Planctomycetota bacterium]MBL7039136.1 hypothetical protein [Pirellulaceae bacterium]
MHIAKLCTNLCIEDFEVKTIAFNIVAGHRSAAAYSYCQRAAQYGKIASLRD